MCWVTQIQTFPNFFWLGSALLICKTRQICLALNIKQPNKNRFSVAFFLSFLPWLTTVRQPCPKKRKCCFLICVGQHNKQPFLNFFCLSSALLICTCCAKVVFPHSRKHFQSRSLMKKKLRNSKLVKDFCPTTNK